MRRFLLLFVALLPFVVNAQTQHQRYKAGEVIVKFNNSEALVASNRSNVRRAVAPVSNKKHINDVFQQLRVREVEQLMPLTASTSTINSHRSASTKDLSQLYLLRFDSMAVASVEEAVVALRQLDDVEYAEPNYIRHIFGTNSSTDYTSASMYNEQWYLQAINMPYLWQQPIVNNKKPVIAILDSGVEIDVHGSNADFKHQNLKGQYLNGGRESLDGEDNDGNGFVDDIFGYDFISSTWEIHDGNGHGTHCAGIALGKPNNGKGIVGANPDAKLLAVKVMDDSGSGDDAAIINGIDYAVITGADIISMSWGGYDESEALRDVLQSASQQCILVASAGNDGLCVSPGHDALHSKENNAPSFPAAYPFVLAVQATDEQGYLASFSNYDCDGPYLSTSPYNYNYDLRAPGVNMLSSYAPQKDFVYMDGTSMACPLVAGAISRLMQCGKVTDFNSLRDLMIKTGGQMIDMKAIYEATEESMNAETFQCDINGVTITFHKTSETTAQVGNGIQPALSIETTGRVEIPNDVHGLLVTAVAANAFSGCSHLTEMVLPCHIATIGAQAFKNCSQLSQLMLMPITVPVCDADAFDESAFTSCYIDVPMDYGDAYKADAIWGRFAANINELYARDGIFYKVIDNFEYCLQITSSKNKKAMLCKVNSIGDTDGMVTVPEFIEGYQVTSIGFNAFAGRDWLKQIILPDCITEFESTSFANSQNLVTVNYPASLKRIGGYAFRDCISFKNGHIPGTVKEIEMSAFENTGIEEFILDEGVESMGIYAIAHCQQLKRIYIPSTFQYYFNAMPDLPNVEQIEVAESNPYYDSRNNCNAIIHTKENHLLRGCKNTVIPPDVSSLSSEAFWGTKGLVDLYVPKSTTHYFAVETYRGCPDLASITVDANHPYCYSPQGSNAVIGVSEEPTLELGCSNTVIPEHVSKIGMLAFYRNSGLSSITIPVAMNIERLAFGGCPLTSITSLSKKPRAIDDNAFYDYYYNYYKTDNRAEDALYENATLYVPFGTKDVYSATDGWSQFQHIVELDPVMTGDIDNNGSVDEADRQALINHLLGKEVSGYHPTAADVDGDGRVNVRDVVALADILAGKALRSSDEYAYFSIGNYETIRRGRQCSMNVVTRSEPVAIYLRFLIPEGFSVDKDQVISAGSWAGLPEGVETYSNVTDRQVDIVITSSGNAILPDATGVSILMNIAEDAPLQGSLNFYYCIVSEDGRITEATAPQPYYAVLPGDANEDKVINVTDIMRVANYILNIGRNEFTTEAVRNADVNEDGVINVTDIMAIANIILKVTPGSNARKMESQPQLDPQ